MFGRGGGMRREMRRICKPFWAAGGVANADVSAGCDQAYTAEAQLIALCVPGMGEGGVVSPCACRTRARRPARGTRASGAAHAVVCV